MKLNLGLIDRGIRMFLAILIIDLYITKVLAGGLAFVLIPLAAFFIITGLISFCPIYNFIGISTKKKTLSTEKKGNHST